MHNKIKSACNYICDLHANFLNSCVDANTPLIYFSTMILSVIVIGFIMSVYPFLFIIATLIFLFVIGCKIGEEFKRLKDFHVKKNAKQKTD